MDGLREGFASVRGGRVWYGIAGAGARGVPLVIVHGGPGAPHDYLEPLAALADERPVVFYDQLGCGNSEQPQDTSLWTLARFVEELDLLRSALGLAHLHLLGQSWGTALACEYLLTKPAPGVVAAVLSGPLLSASRWIDDQRTYLRAMPPEVQDAVARAERCGDFQAASYQQAMLAYYRRHVCRLDPWPECLDRAFAKLAFPVYLHMWGPSEFSVTGTLRGYERVDALRALAVPVLFTCGEYDEASPATTRQYQGHVAGSELVVFEGASHEHHLECTEAYLQAVRGFLRNAERMNW